MKQTFFSKWKIKTQMLSAMILLIFFSTVSLSLINLSISRSIIEGNYKKTYENNLKAFNSTIDYKLQTVNELVRAEVYQKNFYNALKEKPSGKSKYFSTASSMILRKIALNLESQSTLIDAVFCFNNDGRYYQHFRGKTGGSAYLDYYDTLDATKEDWYLTAKNAKGRECYFGYSVLMPKEKNDKVSMVKEIRHPSTQESLGMLILYLNKNFLRTSLWGNSKEFKSDTLMILDEQAPSHLLYYTGNGERSQKVLEHYLKNGETPKSPFLYTSYVNKTTNWKIVNGIEKGDLSNDTIFIGTTMIVTTGLIVLMGAFLSGLISKKINQPLHKLETVLQKVQQGSRHIEEEFDDSEIGRVGNILKETVNHNIELKERLLELNLKERESELLLLQAQINPHFLYNTLDSIYCQAMLKNETDIGTMVNNLSETFKISLNNGKKIVQVADELEYIRRYMEIQNVRYEGRFELIIEIEKELMEFQIIKLILQPFVENSMYHGLEPKPGPGFIEIKGERMENDLYFTISDNGIGMKNTNEIYSGFGIRNVIERIHLFYGEEYGISVTSKENFGTKINIHIPVIKERDSNDNTGNY